MKTIWKFPINITDEQSLQIPDGARILSAQVQNNQLCIWALVDPEKKKVNRTVKVFGTGNPVSNEGEYIDTFQTHEGSFVGHVFIQ